MIHTYRKWKNTGEVFYLATYDKEDNNYYCKAPYYEDSWIFETDYIKQESIKASILDILKYKIEKLLYKI